jgi:hypothetical protein
LARKALAEAPLDLPQVGEFSGLRGTQKQLSLGAAAVRERHATGARRSTQLIAGLLLERVEVGSLRMGYRLASGGDSGVAHTLQYAASPSFVTPFVGWQQTRQASARFAWSPRAMLVVPLPPRDLDVALAGSPLDPAAPPDSPPIQMGDAFIVLGLALRHRPSGLEIDLGGRVYYAAAESASHPGVDGARVVHIAWHHGVR